MRAPALARSRDRAGAMVSHHGIVTEYHHLAMYGAFDAPVRRAYT